MAMREVHRAITTDAQGLGRPARAQRLCSGGAARQGHQLGGREVEGEEVRRVAALLSLVVWYVMPGLAGCFVEYSRFVTFGPTDASTDSECGIHRESSPAGIARLPDLEGNSLSL